MERRFALVLLVVMLALAGASACSRSSRTDPLGSSSGSGSGSGSGGGGGGGSTPVLTTYSLMSNAVSGYWHGITLVSHIQNNENAMVGPVNPITGLNSLQLVSNTMTGCVATIPASMCPVPNGHQTTGSYRLATCRPGVAGVPCPVVDQRWFNIPSSGAAIAFDLKIDIPLVDISSVYVAYGNPGCARKMRLTPAQVSAAVAGFTHIHLPLNRFEPVYACAPSVDYTMFQLDVFRVGLSTASSALMAIENVTWTN